MEPLKRINEAWNRNTRSVLTVFTLLLALAAIFVTLQSSTVDVTQQKQIDALGTALDTQRSAGASKGIAPVVPSSQEIKKNPQIIIQGQPGEPGKNGKDGTAPTDAQVRRVVVQCFQDNVCKGTPTATQVALAVKTYCDARFNCTPKAITPTPGKNGTPGVNGQDGKDGANATDAQVVAAVTSFCSADSKPCQGKDGANGKDGTNGTDGKAGQDGTNGTNGTDGQNGKDAYPFTFEFTFNDALNQPVHMVCLVSDPEVATMCAQQ